MPEVLVMTSPSSPSQAGFTLIEAVIGTAIFSVLVGTALPQLLMLWERWKVMQVAHATQSSLLLARSEAIMRAGTVAIQKIANDKDKKGCQNAGTTSEWSCGWRIYVDTDGNGSWSSTKDELLQEVPLDGRVNVMKNSSGTAIKFDRYGMATGLNAMGFTLSPERTGIASAAAMTVCMSSGGRIRLVHDAGCP